MRFTQEMISPPHRGRDRKNLIKSEIKAGRVVKLGQVAKPKGQVVNVYERTHA